MNRSTIDVMDANPILSEIAHGYYAAAVEEGRDALLLTPESFRVQLRQPDVVITTWPYSWGIEHYVYYRDVVKVLIVADDPYEVDHLSVVARNFDIVCTYEKSCVDKYHRAILLPLGYQEIPAPEVAPEACDVLFLGGEYAPRDRFVRALASAPFEAVLPSSQKYRLQFDRHYQLCRAARINLNVHRGKAELDYAHCSNVDGLEATNLNCRFFQLGAMGAFQLLYANREFPSYIPDEIVFHTADELLEKCRYFLANETRRLEIARAVQQGILPGNSYADRLRVLQRACADITATANLDLTAYQRVLDIVRPHHEEISNMMRRLIWR